MRDHGGPGGVVSDGLAAVGEGATDVVHPLGGTGGIELSDIGIIGADQWLAA